MTTNLSTRIREIRTAAGDTPAKAAGKLGISRQAFNKWETGDTENMKLGNLRAFADAYHVDLAELITGQPRPSATQLQAHQNVAHYQAHKQSPAAMAVADWFDKLPSESRAIFWTSIIKTFMEIRLKNPESDLGDIAEVIDLMRKI